MYNCLKKPDDGRKMECCYLVVQSAGPNPASGMDVCTQNKCRGDEVILEKAERLINTKYVCEHF